MEVKLEQRSRASRPAARSCRGQRSRSGGLIDLRAKDSKSDFPVPVQAPAGAPNILLVLLDDVGFGAASTFGGPCNTPTAERLAQKRAAIQSLPYDGSMLAHAPRAADRPQPPLGAYGLHHGGGDGISRIRHADGQRHGDRRRDSDKQSGYNTSWFGKNHNVPDWHTSQNGPFDLWPNGLGFEHFYGFHRRRHEPVAAQGV